MKQKLILMLALAMLLGCGLALALPDLSITNVVKDPASLCAGQYQVLAFNITNSGDAAASNAIVGLYVDGAFIQSINGINLAAGASARKILLINAGTSVQTVLLKADPYSSITESNEANNNYQYTNTVTSCANSPNYVALKRMYSSTDKDHFYTTSSAEASSATSKGYVYERDEGMLSTNYFTGSQPLLRFYSSKSTSHWYTGGSAIGTMQGLMDIGYQYEKIEGYLSTSQTSGTTALYHAYHPTDIDNFYTINYAEITNAVAKGYQEKAVEGYVYANQAPPATYPDLTIANLNANPSPSCSGNTVTVSYDIKNIGSAAASNVQIGVYSGSTLAKTETVTLSAGASVTKTYSYTADLTAKTIKAVADYNNAITESDENNNQQSIIVSSSNCTITPPLSVRGRVGWTPAGELFVPESVFSGDCYLNDTGIKVSCGTVAGKTGKISGPFDGYAQKYNYNIKSNNECGLSDSSFRAAFNSATAANKNKGFTMFFLVGTTKYWMGVNGSHPDILKDGTYQIMPTLNISSADAVCNSTIIPPVVNYPDLTVTGISASPSTSCSGQQVTVTYTVKNIGNASAGNFQVAVYSVGALAKTDTMNLGAGASGTGTYTYTSDSNPKTITVVADSNGVITESNENNNQAGLTVSIGSCGAKPLSGKIIMLDPGHMPSETDRINSGEYYATHNVSRVLKPLLQNLGATVYETPITYTVTQRAAYANSLNADVYVSIHFNANSDNTVTGLEAYYGEYNYTGGTGGITANKEKDKVVCSKLVPEVQKILSSKLRGTDGIKSDLQSGTCSTPGQCSIWVVRATNMPACLVEMEFMSARVTKTFNGVTYNSYKTLALSADYTNAAANALKNGILNYFGANTTTPPATQPYDKVAFVDNGQLYVPAGVFSGICYINGTGTPIPCGSIAGKTGKISGPFDWYAQKYNFNIQNNNGCGRSDSTFKAAFDSATAINKNKGFTIFFLVGTTKYWMGVNSAHPSILTDGTYQMVPEAGTTITTQQAVC